MHHQRISQPLDNRALSLTEPLDRVTTSCMGDIGGVFPRGNSNVICQGYVADLKQNGMISVKVKQQPEKLRYAALIQEHFHVSN